MALIRGMLMTAVYRKTLEASSSAADDKAALTLMGPDVDRISNGLKDLHELWANIVQIGVATYLLEIELKYACVAPALVAAACFVVTAYLTKFTKSAMKNWMGKLQLRTSQTSSMLDSMKSIKLSGLSAVFGSLVARLRKEEIRSSKQFRLLGAATSAIALLPQLLSPVLAFVVYTAVTLKQGGYLDVSRLFTSLSIMVLISQPLYLFFYSVVSSRAAIGCFERIQEYLCDESHTDFRKILGDDPIPPETVSDIEEKESSSADRVVTKKESTSPRISSINENNPRTAVWLLKNASFGWKAGEKPTVLDIDLEIYQSMITLLVGPSGSGKSTLLKALLGEIIKFEGDVETRQQEIAWCDQTPWLMNKTIKENIIGESALDDKLYSTVLNCCELQTDLESLEAGDQTKVGSKGAALSGGQKQRLALARAVYSRKEVMLFDDPFSGLDNRTEKSILQRLFGPTGLLRAWKTTVVVASHSVHVLPLADQIVALNQECKISEQGSYRTLSTSGGYVQNLHEKHISTLVEQADEEEHEIDQAPAKKVSPSGNPEKPAKVEFESTAVENNRDASVYRFYFESIGVVPAVTFILLQVIWAFLIVFPVQWLRYWSEANSKHPNKDLGLYLGIYAAFQASAFGSSAILVWFSFSFMARKSGYQLHDKLLKTVMTASLALFSKSDTGSILARFTRDIYTVDMNVPLQLMTMIQNLFVCIAQAAIIASGTSWVAVSYPVLFAVLFLVQRYYLRTAKRMRLLDLSEKSPVYTQFLETLSGLVTIRSFGWEQQFRATNFRMVDKAQKPWYLLLMIQRWLLLVLSLITTALAVIVVGIAVKLRGNIAAGGVAVSLVQIISLATYTNDFITYYTGLETSFGAIARIKDFSESSQYSLKKGENHQPPPDWPSKGEIVLKNVSATYNTESADEKQQLALNDISLTIPAASKIGIVGRTGSGKTSLLMALFRLLDLKSGTIEIDGIDIATLDPEVVRTRLGGLSQEACFLPGTFRKNLDPYVTLEGDEPLIDALEKVGLWALVEQRGGLDEEFKPDALSQGQRQLFCLARTFLRQSKIVALDEVMSR